MLKGLFRGRRRAALLPLLALCTLTAWIPDQKPTPDELPKPEFREIWAYLMRGEEKELTGAEPITDLCYFSAVLTRKGRIVETIARPEVTMRDGRKPAIHLVIAELSNQALMHFALESGYGVRPLLIEDICRVSQAFDGVQIDFEGLHREETDNFADFLKALRSALPAEKKLSIAVPARVKPLAVDAYDYSRISPIVDRMIVMAYDEHWSTSEPGPVASLPWCERVADFARSVIEKDKLVMGLPLYGRAWQDKRLARALRLRNVPDLVLEKNSTTRYAPHFGVWFEYPESVVVTVYYDDARSLMDKLWLYSGKGVGAVAFWRIGQGHPQWWQRMRSAAGSTIGPR